MTWRAPREAVESKTTSEAIGAAAKYVPAIPVGPPVAELGVNGAGTTFVKSFERPTVATATLGKVAGKAAAKAASAVFSIASVFKLGYDTLAYGAGVISCAK